MDLCLSPAVVAMLKKAGEATNGGPIKLHDLIEPLAVILGKQDGVPVMSERDVAWLKGLLERKEEARWETQGPTTF